MDATANVVSGIVPQMRRAPIKSIIVQIILRTPQQSLSGPSRARRRPLGHERTGRRAGNLKPSLKVSGKEYWTFPGAH